MTPSIDTILKPRLTVTHLALVRGWVQGIELSELSERYLAGLGGDDGGVDLREAKGLLMRVLDDLAAMAKRAGIPGSVTLRRQAARIRMTPGAPTLEDFAGTLEDPDFYCESDLVDLYTQRFSRSVNAGARGEARRSRLIARQMNLITDLTHHLSAPMSLQDPIAVWLEDGITQRLDSIGLKTIQDLAVAIVRDTESWFEGIKGIGVGKAERIRRFLVAQRGPLDDSLAMAGTAAASSTLPTSSLPRVSEPSGFRALVATPSPSKWELIDSENVAVPVIEVRPESAVKDLENDASALPLQPPVNLLDGSQGRLRAPLAQSATKAFNDLEALNTWLRLKASSATKILYRREIERLMMWCTRVKQLALSSLSIEDALDYREFLGNVPDAWICKKGTPQDAPEWSPFAGSLSPSSAKKSLVIIHAFFGWLVTSGYLTANPFSGIKVQTALPPISDMSTSAQDQTSLEYSRAKVESIISRALPRVAIQAIERELAEAEQDEFVARARFVFRLAVMTGLRISEIAMARREQLRRIEPTAQDDGGWELSVVGKRGKLRDVPVPDSLIEDLIEYLDSRALPYFLDDVEPGVFLVGKLPSRLKGKKVEDGLALAKTGRVEMAADGVRPQTIHRTLDELFSRAAERVAANDKGAALKLRTASAHWLRHTCATDAVAAEVPLDVVASLLGHSSLTTTSRYVHTEGRRRLKEMKRFWGNGIAGE
jgi:integrase